MIKKKIIYKKTLNNNIRIINVIYKNDYSKEV